MNTKYILSLFALVGIFNLVSCKKKVTDPIPNAPKYDVPTSYNFEAVDYSGQTYRLDMLAEMVTYMKTGNTANTLLDAQKLKDMYANVNNQFTNTALNTSGKKLKDKTFATEVANFESYMDSIEEASTSTVAGSEGVAGVIVSGTSKYLCSANGVEYTQIIEKGLMGAVFYYQISGVYLSEDKLGLQIDKASRQHHWDEAFGYFGVPVDFPTNVTGVRFYGKYANERNALLSCNAKLMNAYLLGRAAINNDDQETVNAQVTIIRDELERVIAATAISYMNKAKAGLADNAIRNHTLSEGAAFIKALLYNPTKKITNAQIDQALAKLQTNGKYNFYEVSDLEMEEVKTILSTVYGFDSIKNTL
jgi:hypothetical protein